MPILVWMVMVVIIEYHMAHVTRPNYQHAAPIHSKSEDSRIYYPAKKFELSANLFKHATKWPKNGKK